MLSVSRPAYRSALSLALVLLLCGACRADVPVLQVQHADSITASVFSPDGTLLATASGDGDVRLWRASDGVLLATFAGHSGSPIPVFSPDGRTLVTWCRPRPQRADGRIRFWDVATGQSLGVYASESREVHQVAFSPDGKRLAVAWPNAVRVLDLSGRKVAAVPLKGWDMVQSLVWGPRLAGCWTASSGKSAVLVYDGALASGTSLKDEKSPSISPDGLRMATRSGRSVVVRTLAELRVVARLEAASKPDLFAWSRDGRWLAGAGEGQLSVWNVSMGGPRDAGVNAEVAQLAFAEDGRLVAARGDTGQVVVWSSGIGVRTLGPNEDAWRDAVCALSPDARKAAVMTFGADNSRRLRVMDTSSGRSATKDLKGDVGLWGLTWLPDGRELLLTQEQEILWVSPSDAKVRAFTRALGPVKQHSMHLARDGERLVTVAAAGEHSRIYAWEGRPRLARTVPQVDPPVDPGVRHVAWGGDGVVMRVAPILGAGPGKAVGGGKGRALALSSGGSVLGQDGRVWSLGSKGGKAVGTGLPGPQHGLFDPAGRWLAVWWYDSDLGLFDGLRQVQRVRMEESLPLVFGPSGLLVLGGGWGGQPHPALVWDVARGARAARLTGHEDQVSAAAFDGRGRLLVTGDGVGGMRVWEVAGWKLRASWNAGGRVRSAAFTPSGRVVTLTDDGTVRFWSSSGQWVGTAALLDSGKTWVVFTADGRVDGPAARAVAWRVGKGLGDVRMGGGKATISLVAELRK